METNFENLGLYDLTEEEAYEIDGGGYLKYVDGKWIWVED